MAAITVTLTKITKEAGGGRILIRFGKREYEFRNLAHVQDYVQTVLSREVAEAIFLAILIQLQPNITNPSIIEGHSITIDPSLVNWGTRA